MPRDGNIFRISLTKHVPHAVSIPTKMYKTKFNPSVAISPPAEVFGANSSWGDRFAGVVDGYDWWSIRECCGLGWSYRLAGAGLIAPAALAAAGGGGNGAMPPPLTREDGAILSYGPTFEVKRKK